MAASNDQRLERRARDVERDVPDVVVAARASNEGSIARVGACGESNRIQPKSDIVTSRRVASRAMSREWRRGRLSFKEKFIDPCVVDGVLVRQYASAEAFAKSTATSTAGRRDDDDDDDDDRVPGTGFTVWDASALLGKYVGREDVWERLTAGKRRDGTRAPTTTLELGAGTGLATLLVASSEIASREEGGLVCVMTDLPEVVALARANARENKEENGGRVPRRVLLATRGVRWGREEDVEALPEAIRWPDVVLGADLMYTSDQGVIRALAKTTGMLVRDSGRVAVFAACREHRPESIELFVSILETEGFTVRRVPASTVHPDYPASDDEFEILECWRR